MPTDREGDVPEDAVEVAEVQGAQQGPHGNAEQWLRHNLEDEERGPAHAEADEATEQAPSSPRSADTGEAGLVQLPVGARFGLDHEPAPQEREELVRFAAEADRELHGEGQGDEDEDAAG